MYVCMYVCLSLCLYPAYLKKSTEKESFLWKAFIFKITGMHSLLERSLMKNIQGAKSYCHLKFSTKENS